MTASPSRAGWWRGCLPRNAEVMVQCYLVGLIDGFDLLANGLISPRFAAEFAMSPSEVGLVFGLTSLGLFVGSLGGGAAADRFGPKATILGALLLFGTASILSALGGGQIEFTVARVFAGLGLGAVLPSLLAIVSLVSHPQNAARNGTLMASAVPIGGGLAGLFIFFAPIGVSWRFVLQVGGWIPLLLALLIAWRLPDLRGGSRWERVPLSALFQGRGLRVTAMLWLAFVTMLMISYVLINWLPTFFGAMGLSGRHGGLVMLFFSASGSLAAMLFGQAMRHSRLKQVTIVGYAGTIAGIVALSLVGKNAGLATVIACVSCVSFFQTGAQYLLYGISPTFYPGALKGTGAGAAVAAGRVGAVIGPWAAGLILAHGGNAQTVLLATLPICLVSMLAALLLLSSGVPVVTVASGERVS